MPNNITPEERERRRQHALQLHAEGRLGGAGFGRMGGRPKIPRVSDIVAAELAQHAQKIVDALLAGMSDDQPAAERSRAAERAARILQRHDDRQVRQEAAERAPDRFDAMTRDELNAELAANVVDKLLAGELPQVAEAAGYSADELARLRAELEPGDVVDAEVVETQEDVL